MDSTHTRPAIAGRDILFHFLNHNLMSIYDSCRQRLLTAPFAHKITQDDADDVKKIELWINIRVHKSTDVLELQRLDMLERVLYKLKLALVTELWYNRQVWVNERVRYEYDLEELQTIIEGLKDDITFFSDQNDSLIEMLISQKHEIKSLQNQLNTLTDNDKSTAKVIRFRSDKIKGDGNNTDTETDPAKSKVHD